MMIFIKKNLKKIVEKNIGFIETNIKEEKIIIVCKNKMGNWT
jgi:hypothetical protein